MDVETVGLGLCSNAWQPQKRKLELKVFVNARSFADPSYLY